MFLCITYPYDYVQDFALKPYFFCAVGIMQLKRSKILGIYRSFEISSLTLNLNPPPFLESFRQHFGFGHATYSNIQTPIT